MRLPRQLTVVVVGLIFQTQFFHLNQANFLHAGCSIQNNYKSTTFEDSVFFYMLFPPRASTFSIEVDQRGIKRRIQTNESTEHQQKWLALELVLKERLEVRFRNGSVWLTEDDKVTEREPEKVVKIRGSRFMTDCPQETPNWRLEDGYEDMTLMVGAEKVVLSAMPTSPTRMFLTVAREEMVICWTHATNTTFLSLVTAMPATCDPLPAYATFWLALDYDAYVFKVTRLGNNEDILWVTHLDDMTARVTFKGSGLSSAVYMVHHLRGFPPPLPPGGASTVTQPRVTQRSPEGMCVKVSLPLVAVLGLLLIAFSALAMVFYHRWTKVLVLLRGSTSGEGQCTNFKTLQNHHGPTGTPPTLPSSSPPSLHAHYVNQPGNVSRSEHVYEEVDMIFGHSQNNPRTSHENPIFDHIHSEDKKVQWQSKLNRK
nr:uncharacterized protein LOC123762118 [Procambarus clarkii]